MGAVRASWATTRQPAAIPAGRMRFDRRRIGRRVQPAADEDGDGGQRAWAPDCEALQRERGSSALERGWAGFIRDGDRHRARACAGRAARPRARSRAVSSGLVQRILQRTAPAAAAAAGSKRSAFSGMGIRDFAVAVFQLDVHALSVQAIGVRSLGFSKCSRDHSAGAVEASHLQRHCQVWLITKR